MARELAVPATGAKAGDDDCTFMLLLEGLQAHPAGADEVACFLGVSFFLGGVEGERGWRVGCVGRRGLGVYPLSGSNLIHLRKIITPILTGNFRSAQPTRDRHLPDLRHSIVHLNFLIIRRVDEDHAVAFGDAVNIVVYAFHVVVLSRVKEAMHKAHVQISIWHRK